MNESQLKRLVANEAEQSVIGAMLLDNDSVDRISGLSESHFYHADHRKIFAEIQRQIIAGKTADVISVADALQGQVGECLVYLNQIYQNTPSAANIKRYADIVKDRAIKRAVLLLSREIGEMVLAEAQDAAALLESIAAKVDGLESAKTTSMPERLSESLSAYMDVVDARMNGSIKPVATGFAELDRLLDGGFERGTLSVLAARPGMGKSAMGLAICRNTSQWGAAAFLSMEMDKKQCNDRNIAALGAIPISWLRNPSGESQYWDALTVACKKAQELEFYLDDETGLNLVDIRSKARHVKRRSGLDLLVIDQLSFITGGSKEKKTYELIGEYTRGLIAVAKQLNCAVLLLCQLNRECESRTNKRPQLSDLASSGSIEQDAANVVFLYRDEIYNADSPDKGMCEVNVAKQRQGAPGTIALTYRGEQARFGDYAKEWQPASRNPPRQLGTGGLR
jgi:replicative DNA helicase